MSNYLNLASLSDFSDLSAIIASTIDASKNQLLDPEIFVDSIITLWGKIGGNIKDQKDLIKLLDDLKEEVKEIIKIETSTIFHYRGNVATVNDLPQEAEIGDVYNVEDTGANYAWSGSAWDKLSETIDLSVFLTKEAFNTAIEDYYTKTECDNKFLTEHQDISGKANQTDLEAEITNRQNIESKLLSKIWSNNNLDTGHFYSKLTNAQSGYALVFNKSDGGGSQVFDKTANVISYVGTNLEEGEGNKESAVNVQIYSKDKTSNEGVIINVNSNKAFYLKGANKTNVAARELVVKEDISTLDNDTANITALLSRLNALEDKVADLKKTNIETLASETSVELTDTNVDYVVTGNITAGSTINGKSLTLKDTDVTAAVVNVTTTDDTDIKNMTIEGAYNKDTQGNSMMNIHSNGYITIKDTTISATGYNGVEIGLSTGIAKNVLIDNVDFSGKFTNNAISIYQVEDDAVITISNCHFEEVSNVLRLSNTNNKKCTINIVNCTCDKWDTGAYAGLIICQDYTSASAAAAEENNLFAPEKMTINIQNLIKPDGTKLERPENIADICGSGDNQILYVYRDKGGLVAYDATKFPKVNVL